MRIEDENPADELTGDVASFSICQAFYVLLAERAK